MRYSKNHDASDAPYKRPDHANAAPDETIEENERTNAVSDNSNEVSDDQNQRSDSTNATPEGALKPPDSTIARPDPTNEPPFAIRTPILTVRPRHRRELTLEMQISPVACVESAEHTTFFHGNDGAFRRLAPYQPVEKGV